MSEDNGERSILLQAWIEARNEVDRSIFLSASAGVGFCVSQLFGEVVIGNTAMTAWLCIACVSFMLSAVGAVWIFRGNAGHFARLIQDESASTKDLWLERLDKAVIWLFVLAVVALGAAAITHLMEEKGNVRQDHAEKPAARGAQRQRDPAPTPHAAVHPGAAAEFFRFRLGAGQQWGQEVNGDQETPDAAGDQSASR